MGFWSTIANHHSPSIFHAEMDDTLVEGTDTTGQALWGGGHPGITQHQWGEAFAWPQPWESALGHHHRRRSRPKPIRDC